MSTREHDRYAPPGAGPTDEDLEHEIELTRRELGNTVAELAYKVDVKARAQDKAHEIQEKAHEVTVKAQHTAHDLAGRVRRHPGTVAAAAGGTALALTTLIVLRTRRR